VAGSQGRISQLAYQCGVILRGRPRLAEQTDCFTAGRPITAEWS